MPRFLSLTIVALASSLVACSNLAPRYEQPAAPIPAAYDETSTSTTTPDIGWKEFFSDATLRQLIESALQHNRDLRIAALNIDRARATYQIQDAQSLPSVAANAAGSISRVPASLSGAGSAVIGRQYSANLGITAYELDLFGRVRSMNEQALEQFLATDQARRATQLSVVASVAQAWLGLAADLERLGLARETLRSQAETLALTQARLNNGYGTELSLRQVETSVETARGDVARYTGQVAADQHALSLLVGTVLPEALQPAALVDELNAMGDLPVGLPSELLLRRPDVLQAEHQLKASHANIGAARAAFYPRISLTAAAGSSSTALSDLFKSGSSAWSFVPQISLPIFDGGANQANLDSAKAAQGIALAQYEQAIQAAFREVSDGLSQRTSISAQLQSQRALLTASEQVLKLSEARYTHGVDSYLPVLDAQRSRYSAAQGLISLRLNKLNNDLALYKGLGGGWTP
ncbi:multidrug efflux system outer membrane protein [Sphaerotilus hippei]|uniref:Multidrug efflux system outer membrane protein n=1 Tax=Sphaerotilus hippei TaxID=744406 RepID=A0A318GWX9_9BURK|nr:efflux transporter outer membrane subunit [Sphaerotilus hippei]PXW91976.1 multidrug efflux system outer membrane protein [Sphaerotilus hippei]